MGFKGLGFIGFRVLLRVPCRGNTMRVATKGSFEVKVWGSGLLKEVL